VFQYWNFPNQWFCHWPFGNWLYHGVACPWPMF
jgi:hypothetical protein